MPAVLRQRSFALLFAGTVISTAGDYVLFVALPYWAYQLTGSAAAPAAIFLAQTLPRLVVSPIAGVFVDRWNRKAVMIASDLLRAGIVLAMLGVRSAEMLPLLVALTFAESCVSRFFFPARTALLPRLVEGERLLQANAAMGFGEAAAMLGGPALGGMLLAVSGAHGVVVIDAISYLASAALIAAIVVPPAAVTGAGDELTAAGIRRPQAAVRAVWTELRQGVTVVLARPTLRILFAAGALLFLGSGITNVLIVVMVGEVWGGGAPQFGWLITAIGAGALVGGPLMGVVSGRLGARALIALGGLGLGAVLLAIVNQPSIELAIAAAAPIGVFQVWSNVGMTTLLQTGSDDRNRGRVASLFAAVTGAAALPSAALAGAVAALIGVRLVLDAAGLLFAASGLVALVGRRSPATVDSVNAAMKTAGYAEVERR